VSETADSYLLELEQAEAEADALLAEVDPEGVDRKMAVTRQLRGVVKRQRERLQKAVAEAKEQARQELVAERQRESAFRRLSVPPSARPLFEGVDFTDSEAMAARADELRSTGLSWEGMPQPPAPPPPDPNMVAVQQMQMAAAGGVTSESAGDLKTRMLAMKADPGRYTDEQIAGVVQDYNRAVMAAERPGSGALS
jgi:hypothetical protein